MGDFSGADSGPTFHIEGFTPYAQVPRWVLRAGDVLSHGSVRLYGVIMSYAANDTRAAFPGRERLAEDMGVKVRSISAYIKELEGFGALIVQRRRNKRTGNFYANHYVLVFREPGAENCTRRDAVDCPITTPTVLPTPTNPFTSEESDPGRSCTSDLRSDANNPGDLSEDQRRTLRRQLQVVGSMLAKGRKFHDGPVQDQWCEFIGLMEEAMPDTFDGGMADLLDNGKWTVSAKVAGAYQAGVELNKILHTAALR